MNDPQESDALRRKRDAFWGHLYDAQLRKGRTKEQARRYACTKTIEKYGSTPFAKEGD